MNSIRFRTLYIFVLFLVVLLIFSCGNADLKQFYNKLNELSEETELLIKTFNDYKEGGLDDRKALKNIYMKSKKNYDILLKLFLKTEKLLKNNEAEFFKKEFAKSFQEVNKHFKILLEANEKISSKNFAEKYNNASKSINDFKEKHNNFIKMLKL